MEKHYTRVEAKLNSRFTGQVFMCSN